MLVDPHWEETDAATTTENDEISTPYFYHDGLMTVGLDNGSSSCWQGPSKMESTLLAWGRVVMDNLI
jgi:hypothetical protein